MQRILALDPGDQWTGTALSDALGFTAKPFKTISTASLTSFIEQTMREQQLKEVVLGYPLTLRGTHSDQTRKVITLKESLEETFPTLSWRLWDERLTSKRADMLKRAKTKQEKLEAHSIAAAFILQSYLDYLHQQKEG